LHSGGNYEPWTGLCRYHLRKALYSCVQGSPGSVAYGVAGMSCAGIPTNQFAEDSLRILKTPTWVTLGRIAAAEGKALMCLAEGVQASN
jgi:hypothetical protein